MRKSFNFVAQKLRMPGTVRDHKDRFDRIRKLIMGREERAHCNEIAIHYRENPGMGP